MVDEELFSLQLDKPFSWGKSNEQVAKHTLDTQFETKPIERSLHLLRKGDDSQKLSVIQALPQLLQYDPNGTLNRIVPKIQQELPKSSCEFHIATSKIFKLLIEKQIPLNLMGAVLQGADSKDPVVSNAWIETLLAVIPVLPIDQIRTSVLPMALSKSQPSCPIYSRIASCKIFGKCAVHPKMENIDVKTIILPPVQSLCQDCFHEVRAIMCAQLPMIAQGLGENLVTTSLLPSLVELATDDSVSVRSSAVASAVLMIPFLNKQTKIETIVPLVKQLCQKTTGSSEIIYPTISKEYGKLVDALKNDLDTNDCVWFLQFYKTLATKGQTVRVNKDNTEVTQDVVCREQCAFNLPAVTLFIVARIPGQLELWHTVFSSLANDPCYLVRKTTAGSVHEVVRILGSECKLVKDDIVKLLRDDAEEVLQMLVPHIGTTLELFCANGVLSREQSVQSSLEIARALLKCQLELAKGYNWRVKTNFLQQLERLPNCMPSDFIHQHFSPVILNCVLETRAQPVKSQACRTLLVFLRYNLKEIQRKWIRDNLISHLCKSDNCYTRRIFVLLCVHAMEIFSDSYFKKYFFESLISLTDDPVTNIRYCVVNLLPNLYKMLVLPEDKKLQTNMDNLFSKLDSIEKDRDVKAVLKAKMKEVRTIGPTNKHYLTEQKRKEEEENKISQGKSLVTSTHYPAGGNGAKSSSHHLSRDQTGSLKSPMPSRSTSAPPRVKKGSSGSGHLASDMSFLEQHFYIDAGINLPRDKIGIDLEQPKNLDICNVEEIERKLNLVTTVDDSSAIATVSAENVDIDTMSESDLKQLETSTTNITDDVKVNLRKRNKKSLSKIPPKNQSREYSKYKRYSSVFPTTHLDTAIPTSSENKSLNRRSINIGASDFSKIPVCLKKSKSNADVKRVRKYDDIYNASSSIKTNVGDNINKSDGTRIKPKSGEIAITTNSKHKLLPLGKETETPPDIQNSSSHQVENNSIKSDVPINTNKETSKISNLPVLKRRTLSEVRK